MSIRKSEYREYGLLGKLIIGRFGYWGVLGIVISNYLVVGVLGIGSFGYWKY